MLGQFLEFSIAAQPLAPAFEFYTALGFQAIPVGDSLQQPYAGLIDGTIAIGLHDREHPTPALTFVRPQLRDYVRGIRRLGITLDYAHLGDDEFNRVGFTDPSGQAITLLEARTFAPGRWNPHNVTACGAFVEYSIPTPSLAESQRFWETLGLRKTAEGSSPHPWLRLEGRGISVGLHEAPLKPGLTFRTSGLEARLEFLRAKGLAVRAGSVLADAGQRGATLVAPEGTGIYLIEDAGDE
jgi:catechol 2,3-dioxygenase-like lactoylglutathione lyase family enzyme